jgi:predicted nucleotidyltransferase component of viral defense system
MSWEESKALTALKRDFLLGFFDRHQEFYLSGGSALGIFYLGHRLSYDLDFFTPDTVNWNVVQNSIRMVADHIGAELTTVSASPAFYRFELRRDNEREILDFVVESVPQVDPEKERFDTIRVDTIREITVNKVCTLIGRCEVKDLVDLYFLEKKRGLTVAEHFEAAQTKEGGLDPAMISYLLATVDVDSPPNYLIESLDLADFRAFVERLRTTLADEAFPG